MKRVVRFRSPQVVRLRSPQVVRLRSPQVVRQGSPQVGFTLLELLVVIGIMMLILGITVAMFGSFFKGQAIKEATNQVIVGLTQAKSLAADKRIVHFVVFENKDEAGTGDVTGVMRIYQDRTGTGTSGIFDEGPNDEVDGGTIKLPVRVKFKLEVMTPTQATPNIAIYPTGYCTMSGSWPSKTLASTFDYNADPTRLTANIGDIVIEVKDQYQMCMDVDEGSGKVRRWYFVNLLPP